MNENKRKTVEYGKYGYMFIAPFFIVFLIFQLYPLLNTFIQSLNYKQQSGRNNAVIIKGLKNYSVYVFGEGGTELWASIGITIVLWLCNFVPQILLSLLLAAWFTDQHNRLKGQGAYKVIMYMPNIITAASLAFLFYGLFGTGGIFPQIFKDLFGMHDPVNDKLPMPLLDRGWYSLFIIAFIQFWMWYGNTMIVLIAGIMGISPSLYEAAMVDGASGRQQFFKITVPLLKPILQYTLVTSAIGGLQMYDIPQMFNDGGPKVHFNGKNIDSTTTIVMLIKKYLSSSAKDVGKASAYSVVLFCITLVISLVFYFLTAEKKTKR